MDKEKNRIKLKKGLQQLPNHQPPKDLWGKISQSMDQEKADKVLQAAIAKLPQHNPPEMVWDLIEAELGEAKVVNLKKRSISRWLSAASVALLIGFGGWWLLSGDGFSDETVVTIAYATVETQALERGEDQAAGMIDRVIAEVQQIPHTWEAPKTVALRTSLESIKSSIDQFKLSGEKYGMNQKMHEQLTDMYNKRNKIVRALAAMI